MFDVLAFPDQITTSVQAVRPVASLAVRLVAPLRVGPDDEAEFVCMERRRDHLNRHRPCAWHVVLHRGGGPDAPSWTHLYRVVPEHGGVLVLLHRAVAGDRRACLRRLAGEAAGAQA